MQNRSAFVFFAEWFIITCSIAVLIDIVGATVIKVVEALR